MKISRISLPLWVAVVVLCILAALAFAPHAARAQSTPPYYTLSGTQSGAGGVSFSGLTGEATCSLAVNTSAFAASTVTANFVQQSASGASGPVIFYSGVGANLGTSVTVTVGLNTLYWPCPNASQVSVNFTGSALWTFTASPQTWPFGNVSLQAAAASPAPANVVADFLTACGGVVCAIAPIVASTSAPINASTVGSTNLLVAASSGKSIYVTAFSFTLAGTAPTASFAQGPNCTAPAALTGTYAPITGAYINQDVGIGFIFWTNAGNALCMTLGGTTPSAQGVLSYAQF